MVEGIVLKSSSYGGEVGMVGRRGRGKEEGDDAYDACDAQGYIASGGSSLGPWVLGFGC